jgi:hypothetical protein
MREALVVAVALGLSLVLACRSPEAARIRGAGAGSGPEIGKRGREVDLHAGSDMYFGTPCVTLPVRCSGPRARFAPARE